MDKPSTPTVIKFDYIKSNFFRVVHGDGIFGGLSTQGKVFFTVYSERPSIPQQMVYQINENRVGDEDRTKRVDRDAVIREAEVGVLMDLDKAKSFHAWLGDKIATLEKAKPDENDKKV